MANSTNSPAGYDVRIPERYIEMLHKGNITASMLVALVVLYKWSDWTTGEVEACSAKGLQSWSHKAFSERTFSEALRKLEHMGEITRQMTTGSHDDYPVILHNYKKYDAAGTVQMINPKQTKTWKEIKSAQCDEASDETSYEGSDETSDKVLSQNESQDLSQIKSQNEDKQVSKQVRKKEAQPTASLTSSNSKELEQEKTSEFESKSEPEPEPEPEPADTLVEDLAMFKATYPDAYDLTLELHPYGSNRERMVYFLEAMKIYDFLAITNIDPLALLKWNRAHKKGGLIIRSLSQFFKALGAKNHALLNDYATHDFESCKECKRLGLIHPRDVEREEEEETDEAGAKGVAAD